jgi:hypothetical protein
MAGVAAGAGTTATGTVSTKDTGTDIMRVYTTEPLTHITSTASTTIVITTDQEAEEGMR